MMDEKQSMDFTKIFANLPLPNNQKKKRPSKIGSIFVLAEKIASNNRYTVPKVKVA